MMKTIRQVCLGAILLCGVGSVLAQPAFPARTIRIVVPFTAGGPTDVLGRAIAEKLSPKLGVPVVIDNKPGASTIIGAEAVATSAADGYTLLMTSDATYSINPLIYRKLPYSPKSDLAPIVAVAHLPEYLIVRSDTPARNAPEFVAYAKANPGKLSYGSFGVGSSAHLAAEAFDAANGLQITHVPFKGAADVITAIVGGQVDMVITSLYAALPYIKEGRLKVLGTSAPMRTPAMPEVPTLAEQGIRGLETNVWFGLFARSGTPDAVLTKLAGAIDAVVADPEFVRLRLLPYAMNPAPAGRGYFQQVLKDDEPRYERFVRMANITPE